MNVARFLIAAGFLGFPAVGGFFAGLAELAGCWGLIEPNPYHRYELSEALGVLFVSALLLLFALYVYPGLDTVGRFLRSILRPVARSTWSILTAIYSRVPMFPFADAARFVYREPFLRNCTAVVLACTWLLSLLAVWAWFGLPFPGRYAAFSSEGNMRLDTWTGEVVMPLKGIGKPGVIYFSGGNGRID